MSQKAIEIKEKFGSYDQFATRYSPAIQRELKSRKMDYAECFKASFPLLSHLGEAYTEEGILLWLKIQFDNLNDFCGVKEKLTDNQIVELADIIYFDYYYLNVAEVALFFSKYKTGYYGEFYGVVDPLKITSALLQFKRERMIEIIRIKREEDAKAKELYYQEHSKKAISREEYLLEKRRDKLRRIKIYSYLPKNMYEWKIKNKKTIKFMRELNFLNANK